VEAPDAKLHLQKNTRVEGRETESLVSPKEKGKKKKGTPFLLNGAASVRTTQNECSVVFTEGASRSIMSRGGSTPTKRKEEKEGIASCLINPGQTQESVRTGEIE